MERHKEIRAGHRQDGGVGGCSSGVFCENHILGSEFSKGMRTHTLSEYPLGKPLEAKLLKELREFWSLAHRHPVGVWLIDTLGKPSDLRGCLYLTTYFQYRINSGPYIYYYMT